MRAIAMVGAIVGALALALLPGCSNTTGGELVTLPFVAGGVARDATQPFAFTTPTGWDVTLDQALIAVGPFYFNVEPPSSDEFRSGVVILQATEQAIVDTLDPTPRSVSGGANGETGEAVSVEIGLLAPDATNQSANPDAAELLGSACAVIAGTAVEGAMTVPFQGAVMIDNTLVTTTEPLADLQRVRGAAVDLEIMAAPQQLELQIDPTHWFDQSEFSQIAVGAAPPGGFTWATDTTFAAQLLEGVKSDSAVYLFDVASSAPAAGAQ